MIVMVRMQVSDRITFNRVRWWDEDEEDVCVTGYIIGGCLLVAR